MMAFATFFYSQVRGGCMENNVDGTHHRRPCDHRGADAPAHAVSDAGRPGARVLC